MKKKENPKKRSGKKSFNQKGIAMISISGVVVMLMAMLLVQGISLSKKLEDNATKEKMIEAQIEQEHERTAEIEATREYMKTPEYVEEAARDNGMVKDNQIIFKEIK